MKTKNSSAFASCIPRPISQFCALSACVYFHFGASSANAITIYNVTSIGQPIDVSFGNDLGQLAFEGLFQIGSGQTYNFERLRSLHGNAYGISGNFAAGLLGAATVTSVYDPDFDETFTTISNPLFSHSITNYRLSAGGSGGYVDSVSGNYIAPVTQILNGSPPTPISSTNRFTWVASNALNVGASAEGPIATASGQPPIVSVSPTSPYTIRQATLNPTKEFNFDTVDGVATLNFSALYPQGAAARVGLQIRQTTGEAQVNTSDLYLRVQPGIVSPSSFTTATNSLFRWDLKGNTAAGAGTNWTQINFANQLATFAAGTTFVIAFDETTNFLDSFWKQNQSWDIFNGGTIDGAAAASFISNANFTFIGGVNRPADIPNGYNASYFSFNPTTGTLNWTVVPEPGNALVGLILGAGLLKRRRKLVFA